MSETRITDKGYRSNLSLQKINDIIDSKFRNGFKWVYQAPDGQISWLDDSHYFAKETRKIRDQLLTVANDRERIVEAIQYSINEGFEIT